MSPMSLASGAGLWRAGPPAPVRSHTVCQTPQVRHKFSSGPFSSCSRQHVTYLGFAHTLVSALSYHAPVVSTVVAFSPIRHGAICKLQVFRWYSVKHWSSAIVHTKNFRWIFLGSRLYLKGFHPLRTGSRLSQTLGHAGSKHEKRLYCESGIQGVCLQGILILQVCFPPPHHG